MAPEKKRLFAVLFLLFLVMDVVLVVYFLQLGSRKPLTQPPTTNASSQSQATNQKKQPPNKDGDAKTSELLDELLTFAPENGTKKTIIYAGSELLAVEGVSIEEDKATGKVFVRGLRRVETSRGDVMETSADGELSYEPATGKAEVTASSVSFRPATKK